MKILDAYKFCPLCGNKFKPIGNHLQCTGCGKSYYANPKPCTCIILKNENDEYMLVERAVDPKKGYWDLPGGFVDGGEHYEEAVIRETQEELGLEINNISYVGTCYEPYEFQGITYETATVCYAADMPVGAKPKVDDDVASYKFFKLSQMPYDKFAFPSMKKLFEKLN